ncbi:unnamed protein product [Amoebophrya sp. A120]|nr:unnamed protein product [Amoebophrya sp. A120]|eukprot:GSA120T00001682001.1
MSTQVQEAGETFIESPTPPLEVVVHPIVLLSVVDHYNRVAKGTSKRVVGTLLGEVRDNKMHILTSFAVPFEEEARDPNVWFLDHNYHEQLSGMHKKVNAKEHIVGWYSSGPKIKPADIQIHELYRKYCKEPVFLIMEVQPKENELPMEAYYSVAEKTFDGSFTRTFRTIPSAFGADEAEEVGTEHLLRDIQNRATSTLAARIGNKSRALRTLVGKLKDVKEYLHLVHEGKFPYNAVILEKLQRIFNDLPEMQDSAEMVEFCAHETNDQYMGIYSGVMLRSMLALHNLVQNKINSKKFREDEAKAEKEEKDKKEKEAKEKEQDKEKEKDKENKAKGA